MTTPALHRLRHFITEATRLADAHHDPLQPNPGYKDLLAELIRHDDWLPEASAVPHPEYYQQHLLHCDPQQRFSLVSFVWGPGQRTPVHDHTVWGFIGMLRGAEISQSFGRNENGTFQAQGAPVRLEPGHIEALLPQEGDIHRVHNAYDDQVSISIHLYGGNIGAIRRSVFHPETGEAKEFISGYSSATVPNVWDLSAELRR